MKEFEWSSNLAYAVGLMVTDGSLSKDARHLDLTSNDIEQLKNFNKCLNTNIKITWKTGGYDGKKFPRLQFSHVKLYRWLIEIGLMPNKTKIIAEIKVPDKYFFDFLRGHFDGDGSTYSYWDPRWKSSFMIYLQFLSASTKHIDWLKGEILKLTGCEGKIRQVKGCYKLTFAKVASKIIIEKMYQDKNCIHLSRKKEKIDKALKEENKKQAGMGKLVNPLP